MEEIEEMDNRSVMQFLIDNGADVNAKNYFGFTPLHCAVIHRNYVVIDLLIQAGTDINAKSCLKRTALHFAISNYQPKKFKRILPSDGEGADMWMVEKLLGQPDILVDVRDIKGDTPLMWAVMEKQLDAMFALLRRKANPNIRNKDSLTPLHVAMSDQKPCPFIAVALLMHRASIKIADKEGNTPIDLLIQNVIYTQCYNFAYECLEALAFTHRIKKSQKQRLLSIPELSAFLRECSMEVLKMKKDYITNGFSVFQFMLLGSDGLGFDNLFELYIPVIKRLLSFKYPKYLLNILQHIPKTILCIIFELLNFSKSCEEMLDVTDTDSYEDISDNGVCKDISDDSSENVSDSESCENTSGEGGCEEISDNESFEGFSDEEGCENTSIDVCENISDDIARNKKSDIANYEDAYVCDSSLTLNNESYGDVSKNKKCEGISGNNIKDTTDNDDCKMSDNDCKMSDNDCKMSDNDCKMSDNDDYKEKSFNDDMEKSSNDYMEKSSNDECKDKSDNDECEDKSDNDECEDKSDNDEGKDKSDSYKGENESDYDVCRKVSYNVCCENTPDISSCLIACDKETLDTDGHKMTCDIDCSEVKSEKDSFEKMFDNDSMVTWNNNFKKFSDDSKEISDAVDSKEIDCSKIEPRDFFSKIDIFSISKHLSRLDIFCLIVALSKGNIHECMQSIRERDNLK